MVSEPLRNEIFLKLYGDTLKKCSIFIKIVHKRLIAPLTKKLKLKTFAPNDYVLTEGEFTRVIYFIQNGDVII